MGRALPPSFGQNPKEQLLFFGRPSLIVTVVVFISSDYIAQVVPRAWLNSLTSTCSSLGLLLHCDGDDVVHFIMYTMVMMSVMMMMMIL